MIQADLIARIPVNNVLGEGVIWDRQTARFWWTDIEARRLYRYDPGASTCPRRRRRSGWPALR